MKINFGYEYSKGGFVDSLLERFAGPHDFMSSWNYQNIDGVIYLKDNGILTNAGSFMLLFPAAPLAAAPWIQKNLDFIQNTRDLAKDQKVIRENTRDNK